MPARRASTSPLSELWPRLRPLQPGTITSVMLALVLLTALLDLPGRWAYLEGILPIVQRWSQPDEQHRMVSAPAPYDLLKQADALLPRDATVLLVTSGQDVGHTEYVTYHRALYYLAPRPVWWLSPAPSDDTWKSRWWISSPLDAATTGRIVAEKGASYLLALGVEGAVPPGERVVEADGGFLLRLPGAAPPLEQDPGQNEPGPLWPFQVLAATLVILAIGWAALTAISRLGYRTGRVEGIALAWALGVGLHSVLMLWLSAAGVSLDAQLALLSTIAIFAVLVTLWVRHRRSAPLPLQKTPDGTDTTRVPNLQYLLRGLLLASLALQTILVALMAVGRPLHVWDSWANWGVKARIIFLEGGVSPAVYSDLSRQVTHLDYPLLVPLTQAWFYAWVGSADDRLAGLVSLLFYLALAGLFYGGLRRLGVGASAALAATVALATTGHIAGLAGIVFAELPLVVFALIAALYLLIWLVQGESGALVIAAVGAGLVPWTKREGLVLLVALCLGLLLTNGRSRRTWKAIGTFAISAVIFAAPWYLFVTFQGIVNAAFLPVTPGVFLANLGRWSTILTLVWNSLTSFASGYLWPLTLVGGLITWAVTRRDRGAPRQPTALFLPVTALLYVLMTGFMYFFSAFVPYEQHILASVDRLIVQVMPYMLIWLLTAWTSGTVGRTRAENRPIDTGPPSFSTPYISTGV